MEIGNWSEIHITFSRKIISVNESVNTSHARASGGVSSFWPYREVVAGRLDWLLSEIKKGNEK